MMDFFHHEEFIAAHAEDAVFMADMAENLSRRTEQLIAGFVALRVVRFLEIVQIAEDESELPACGQGIQAFFEAPAIQEPVSWSALLRRSRRCIMPRFRSRMVKKRVRAARSSSAWCSFPGAGLMASMKP